MSLEKGWNNLPFKNITLTLDDFPSSLKIVQLSDLHITPKVNLHHLEEMVEQINQINPDLVLFSGDILQSAAHKVQKQLESFRSLRAKSYYVTGNHDIVYGAKNLQIIMQESGVELLDNTIVHLDIQGVKLQLAGLGDRYSFMRGINRDTKKLFASLHPELPTILLAHQPKDVSLIGESRVDLQLSGHTHGGQIYPFSLLVKLAQPYFSGVYKHNKTTLYVNNGIGYWGVQIRYKAPREIAVLTIN
ncbi:MAG: metallophosphoesterase [Sulfurimonas sp.]|uniref:metallophosphoesterase n=1 Tax=Sulfurimonas sp. TaxID=2022749 RepID=UPI0026246784|nr:metallophosphoesterase [Sulfurimonas sp.]MDD2653211.1 metallophosphoesterase [Sulfurimonas sp.]MDD3452536.1 metallophosphoesterase [Sulfurimonas sp.]